MKDLFKFKKIDGVVTLVKYKGNDEKVIIPETFEGEDVTAIGNSAFQREDKSYLKEVVLPPKLESIGSSAFYHCESLEKIELPETLKIIRQNTFRCCKNLKGLILPKSVEKVLSGAFGYCPSLIKVVALNDKIELSKDVFTGCDFLEEVSFNLIKSLNEKKQIKYLSSYFHKWETLTTEIKNELITISKKSSIKNVLFLSNDIIIINILLNEKVKLKLEEINKYLEHCVKLEDVAITAVLLEYKEKNFSKEEVNVLNERNELVEIGLELPTFAEFRKLWLITKIDGEIRITGYKGEAKTQTIPKALADGTPISSIGRSMRGDYHNLEIINIDADLSCINEHCFYNCKLLKRVNLPDKLTKICNHAFLCCEKLEEIVIPASVTFIDKYAFCRCKSLKKVTFLGEIPKLGEGVFVGTPYEKQFNKSYANLL